MLWIYIVDYTTYVVDICCGLRDLCCGHILWITVHMLWIYVVDYTTHVVDTCCGLLDIGRGYPTIYVQPCIEKISIKYKIVSGYITQKYCV